MQTLDFVVPTRNSKRIFVEDLRIAQYQTEGLQEIFQNQILLYLVYLLGNDHLGMRNLLNCQY